jgi:CRISPR/Cas system Type II protein with McrA/HNH and RuvC-like nuclease domain
MEKGHKTKKGKRMGTRKENWQGMNWLRQDKRLAIYLRDGMACMYCGSTIEDGAQLSLDHVKPHSKGGSNSERNLVCCCSKCNSVRGNRPVEDFAADVAGYLAVVTAEDIMASIRSHTRKSLKTYRVEAKELIARRGSAAKALAALASK